MPPRKPTAGFWITVALVAVVVGYPLSVGPVALLEKHKLIPQWLDAAENQFYAPMEWVFLEGPQPMRDALKWYLALWAGD